MLNKYLLKLSLQELAVRRSPLLCPGRYRVRSLRRWSLQAPTGLKDMSLLLHYLPRDKSQELQALLYEPPHGHAHQRRGFGGSSHRAKLLGEEK